MRTTRRDFIRMAGLAPLGFHFAGMRTFDDILPLYIGTYTRGDSKGIYHGRMNSQTGALEIVGTTEGIANPSYLALDPSRRYLYSVSESGDFEGEKSGGVYAYVIDESTHELRLLNAKSSRGGSPCYITVTPDGEQVLVANYGGGNAAILPIEEDGSLADASDVAQHEGSSVNERRQKGPHAHCVITDHAGCHAFVVDLGIDRVMIYRVEEGRLTPDGFAVLKPGAGPRHIVFNPKGDRAYVINELDSTVTAFAAKAGVLEETQTISTLPEDFEGENYPADIRVSPDGRFVYGSNRGHHSIVVYAVDPYSGALSLIQHQSTLGEWPRNFVIDPTGRFLLAANQNTNNIFVFARDTETGMLTATGHSLEVPSPVCLLFA